MSLYENGSSDVEVRAYLATHCGTFSQDLWERFIKEIDEFSVTIKKGKLISNAWWERQGRESLRDKTFNPTLWYMNMRNRFGWRDNENKDNSTENQSINISITRDSD